MITTTRATDTMFDTIQYAYEHHYLSLNEANQFYEQINALAIELVYQLNHKKSSSVSQKDYAHIISTINYMFMHGIDSLTFLKQQTVKECFDKGLQYVQQDITTIDSIFNKLTKINMPINNERYRSVIDKQIPQYLTSLKTIDALFNYSYIQGDLDYPLIDGLPLYQHMYFLQGSDLVLYYLKRLYIENYFCHYFSKAIPKLIYQYEQAKGISTEYITLNFFEIVFYQVIAYYLLKESIGLFLTKNEITNLKMHLQKLDVEKRITEVILAFTQYFPKMVIDYIKIHQQQIIADLTLFTNDHYDLFIHLPIKEDKQVIVLHNSLTNSQFIKLMKDIGTLSTLSEKIAYLQNISINVYDLFDLFNHDIFINMEYLTYFEYLTAMQIAIFIKLLNADIGVFNQSCFINKDLFLELEKEKEWQRQFIIFLKQLSTNKKKAIEKILNHIKITI